MSKKNFGILFIILILVCNFLYGCSNESIMFNTSNSDLDNHIEELDYNKVKNSLIRFHVIANSDSNEDQNLKLKIRNAVLDYLYPYLNNSKSLSETRKILKDNSNYVKQIAEKIVKDNNYSYNVKVMISRENFPEKAYGNIVLPQGNYEAFRIIIGSGKGHNWWCVMFPPLCFVDESKAVVEYDKNKDKIENAVNKNNVDKNTNNDKDYNKKIEEDNKIEYKFKILEIFEGLS